MTFADKSFQLLQIVLKFKQLIDDKQQKRKTSGVQSIKIRNEGNSSVRIRIIIFHYFIIYTFVTYERVCRIVFSRGDAPANYIEYDAFCLIWQISILRVQGARKLETLKLGSLEMLGTKTVVDGNLY